MDKNLESEKLNKDLIEESVDNKPVEDKMENPETEIVDALPEETPKPSAAVAVVEEETSPKTEPAVEAPLETSLADSSAEKEIETPEINSSDKTTEKSSSDLSGLTKDEIIEKLKNLRIQEEVPPRHAVDALKHAYYAIRKAEVDAQREAFEKNAEEGEEFAPAVDPGEDVVKVYLEEIKKKRAKKVAEENKEREANYLLKLGIIEAIKTLTESTGEFNKLFNEFKSLQDRWNEIKLIPQAKSKELWTEYQIQTEKFYDLVKINNELRDYDFKKNLELKTEICESAERLLADEVDTVSAFHQLQNFHQQWREIGPVAQELREELWHRFKEVSTQINKNYQSHFESLKGQEEDNLIAKNAIIDQLKAIDCSQINSYKEWDGMTKTVLDLQSKWKTIGFVPRKDNNKVFEEFRKLCDIFFETKSNFFKKQREEMDANLAKKRALVDRVLELKDSTDWKKTTDILVQLQRDWKKIGPVSRKHSDTIWKEFVGACDHFFEERKKHFGSQKSEEMQNLEAKRAVVEKIKNLDKSLNASELSEQLRQLQDEWHKIGFVPYKEKDKSYQELYAAVDAHYDRMKIGKAERRFEDFKSNVEDMTAKANPERELSKERNQLVYQYNKLKSDLQTYENNMSFLTISSKGKENPLLKDVMKKVESLKNEILLIEKKVEMIDENLKDLD